MPLAIDQHELDALVADRLAWTARCASAFAHDLGNIVLFTDTTDCSAREPNAVQQRDELLRHYREMLAALEVWKNIDAPTGRPMQLADWWRVQSSLIRQFARRNVSIVLHHAAPRGLLVDATILTRLSSATILGIDLQTESVDRITLYTDVETTSHQLRLDFVLSPDVDSSLLIPTVVIKGATVESHPETEPSGQRRAAVTLRVGVDPHVASNR